MAEETQDRPEEQAEPQQTDTESTAEDRQTPEEPEANLPENEVAVEDAGTLRKKVTVTVPRAKIDAKMDEMFGELSSSAQVPGFRVGRAPRRLLEKRFGREVSEDVGNALVGESMGEAIEKTELKVLGEPDIDLDEIEVPDSGDMEFSFEVEIAPEFELPPTDGIRVERPSADVTEERLDEYLQQCARREARFEATDEPVDEGDMVTAGARISGEGIEPVERHGLNLRAAPGQVEGLPLIDLGKELEGKTAGDTVELTVTAPEAHPNEDWRGKELTVAITISQVRRQVVPEIDEEYAAGLGFDSLEELRDRLRQMLEARLEQDAQRAMREQICDHLLEKTDFELPEGVVQRHTAQVLTRRAVDLMMQGVPREQIDEHMAELQSQAGEQARRDLKLSFILGRLADEMDVQVGDEEINAQVAQMAAQQDRRPERVRQELEQDGRLDELAHNLREQKVLDAILEKAEVVETEETSEPDENQTDESDS